MTKFSKTEKMFVGWCGVIMVGLIIVIAVVFGLNNQNKKSKNSQYISLDAKVNTGKIMVNNGKFSDTVCGVNFEVPEGMVESSTVLPLPQEPLVQAVFDDGENKSVFSYICYDGKYTFDQFNGNGDLKTEGLTVGNKNFSRTGNFVYFNKNNKLVIFQMFFTKNDLEVKSGYEEKLIKILESLE